MVKPCTTLRIQGYPNVDYRTLRAKQAQRGFPNWFNHLIAQGFISNGCYEAAKTDKSIILRIGKIFVKASQAPHKIFQYYPLLIPQNSQSEIAQLLRGAPNQTELSLIYLEKNCQYVFVTKTEENNLSSAPPQIVSPTLPLGTIQPAARRPDFSSPPPLGGLITRGTIGKTYGKSRRITLWKKRGSWQTFYIPESSGIKLGELVLLSIEGGQVTLQSQSGRELGSVQIVNEKGEPEAGFRIERFPPYLPWADQIVGHYFKFFSSTGGLVIGRQRFNYPNLAGELSRVNFAFGQAGLFHISAQGIETLLRNFQLARRRFIRRTPLAQTEASTHTGKLVRTVGEKGNFSLGDREIYIDQKYAGSRIKLYLQAGEIVDIYHENGRQIPLSDLRISLFYDENGQNPQILSCENWRSTTIFQRRKGFWKIPEEFTGTELIFCDEKYPVKKGYASRFAHVVDGVIVGFRYYWDPNATPNLKPDDEDILKRLYVNEQLVAARSTSFDATHFVQLKGDDRIKITHWKIPPSGCLRLKAKKIDVQNLKKYSGKYVILILEPEQATIQIYDQPESDPNKVALKVIRL